MTTNQQQRSVPSASSSQDQSISLGGYISILKRRRRQAILIFVAGLVLAVVLAFALPPTYESTGTILIEQQEIPSEMVRSTVTSFADQRIQTISQRVMTSSNLKKVIDKYGLYAKLRESQPDEVVVDMMRKDVDIDVIRADVVDPRSGQTAKATIAFKLSYRNRSPDLAQKVANELSSLFLQENIKTRTELASETTDFLSAESGKLAGLLKELEQKLAKFKNDNADLLPEYSQMKRQLLERVDQQILDAKRQIESNNQQKIGLLAQLDEITPLQTLYTESGQRVLGSTDRLKILRTQLLQAQATYSADHPDIVRIKNEISALKADVGAVDDVTELNRQLIRAKADLAEAKDKYSADHPDNRRLERTVAGLEQALAAQTESPISAPKVQSPDNPIYIQIKARLDGVQSELDSLRRNVSELERRRAEYEKQLAQSPAVERAYLDLMREYENVSFQYRQTKAKAMEAQLAQTLETQLKGERFTLIEPPLYPSLPVSPNRLAILMLGIFAAMAGGFGGALLWDNMDSSIWGYKGVTAFLGQAPLAVIPYIETELEHFEKRRRGRRMIGATAGVFVFFLLTTHLAVKPLDVIWAMGMRRFGF